MRIDEEDRTMMVPKHELGIVIAYVDPGSGMLMLQMLGGGVLGAWFYFRRSVARFAGRIYGRNQPSLTEAETAKPETTTADAR
jgi:hypothetical protein